MGSDNKTKSSSESSDEVPFFKSKIFISILLAIIFFSLGYFFAQAPKSSKAKKGKGNKNTKNYENPTKNKKK